MFKSLKHGKDMALRIVFVMKMFWSFGFVSFGIVSNFVLRYSDFNPAKENDYVSPFHGPSSSYRFYRWSLTINEWLFKLEANAADHILKVQRQSMIEGLSVKKMASNMRKRGFEGSRPGLDNLAMTLFCIAPPTMPERKP
jgi:hypothetical protein